MRIRAVCWLWFLALGAMLAGISGCATNEPDNESVVPWNSPQGWENGMSGLMNQQHE
ncbi:MAG: hypothetical protein ABSE16_08620 [Verrucomicrobiota bacterium]|jgi:hypothetical protein